MFEVVALSKVGSFHRHVTIYSTLRLLQGLSLNFAEMLQMVEPLLTLYRYVFFPSRVGRVRKLGGFLGLANNQWTRFVTFIDEIACEPSEGSII